MLVFYWIGSSILAKTIATNTGTTISKIQAYTYPISSSKQKLGKKVFNNLY